MRMIIMKSYLSTILVSFFLGLTSCAPVDEPKNDGYVETLFKGKCQEYQELLRPQLFPPGKQKNCSKLWNLFKLVFVKKGNSNISADSYEEYSKEANHDIDTQNKVMLWNGMVFPFVEDYAVYSGRYITVRDSLAVHPVKDIDKWCEGKDGQTGSKKSCPAWSKLNKDSIHSFWEHVSRKFALKARGVVNVMMNASAYPAFRDDSIFGRMELPNLDAKRTPKLIAHLIKNLDDKPKETCTSGSLLRLKKMAEDKKMVFECRENEREFRFLQCAQHKEKYDCISLF